MTPKVPALLCAVLFASLVDSAHATSDPAEIQVQTLTASLLKSMRAGSAVSMPERYRILEPVIEQVFALPLMTRICVGRDWENFSPQQQKEAIDAFSRFTIANYAYNFRELNGKKFAIDDSVLSRGEDRIVQSRLTFPDDTPARLLYRMRQVDGIWRIVDVYYNGVSELTLRRSDCSAAIASGGAPVLIAHLNKVTDGLLK